MAPETRRAKRAAVTKALILEKATALFRAHGYEATTARMIAKAAGVSTGAIWPHYTDKATLFAACAGRPPIDDPAGEELLVALRDLYGVTGARGEIGQRAETLLRYYGMLKP